MKCTNIVNGRPCGGDVQDGFCQLCFADYSGVSLTDTATAAAGTTGGATVEDSSSTLHSRQGSSRVGSDKVAATVLGIAEKDRKRHADESSSQIRRRDRIGGIFVEVPTIPKSDPRRLIKPRYLDEAVAKRVCENGHPWVKRLDDGSYKVRVDPHGIPIEKGKCPGCQAPVDFTKLEPMPLLPGEVIASQYRIEGVIAKGGCGYIYLAEDTDVGQFVVIKGQIRQSEADEATSLAEKAMLANLRHPSIVSILGFKKHRGISFIITELIDGKTLKEIIDDPNTTISVAQAIAFTLAATESMIFLHSQTPPVLNPDIKPGNFMQEGDRVRQIDAGGWMRATDVKDITATKGYAPKEVRDPDTPQLLSVWSDQYSLARMALVLPTENKFDYRGTYEYAVPPSLPSLAKYPSYSAWIRRATSANPLDRFSSTVEFLEQGYGALAEVVAIDGQRKPWESANFDGDVTGGARQIGVRYLPGLRLNPVDSGRAEVDTALKADVPVEQRRALLEQAAAKHKKSREAKFRLADLLIEADEFTGARKLLSELALSETEDWRNAWYAGKLAMAEKKYEDSFNFFNSVVTMLPGEPAAKAALGMAAELAGKDVEAITAYDLTSLVDPQYTGATFGLARLLLKEGSRDSAVKALKRVPLGSAAHVPAEMEAVRILVDRSGGAPTKENLDKAARFLLGVTNDTSPEWHILFAAVLEAAVVAIENGTLKADGRQKFLSTPLTTKALRLGIEEQLMSAAHLSDSDEKREELTIRAIAARPRTTI